MGEAVQQGSGQRDPSEGRCHGAASPSGLLRPSSPPFCGPPHLSSEPSVRPGALSSLEPRPGTLRALSGSCQAFPRPHSSGCGQASEEQAQAGQQQQLGGRGRPGTLPARPQEAPTSCAHTAGHSWGAWLPQRQRGSGSKCCPGSHPRCGWCPDLPPWAQPTAGPRGAHHAPGGAHPGGGVSSRGLAGGRLPVDPQPPGWLSAPPPGQWEQPRSPWLGLGPQ